jgi:hypothetical protein
MMEYYLVIKRSMLSSHGKSWINSKYILEIEGSQYQKVLKYLTPII